MISIVVPVYNGENYIRETIGRLLASTYRDIEVVAVDDGSTDNSFHVLTKLAKQDSRVKVFRKENGGVVSARNYGVEQATGEFLCFCDQDDVVEPFMYEMLYQRISAEESDMAICSSGRLIQGEKSGYDLLPEGVFTGAEIVPALLYPMLFNGYQVPISMGEGNHYPHIWVCMFRREFWNRAQLRFRAYVNFEDDLLLKTESLCKAQKVSTVSKIGYYWKVNLGSESYAGHFVEKVWKKQDAVLKDLYKSLEAAGRPEAEIGMFCQVMRCKQYIDAMHYLGSSEKKKNFAYVKKYCNKAIYGREFEQSIQALQYLKKGRIKPGVILPLLKGRHLGLAYLAELVLDKFLLLSLRSSFLTKVERAMKGCKRSQA